MAVHDEDFLEPTSFEEAMAAIDKAGDDECHRLMADLQSTLIPELEMRGQSKIARNIQSEETGRIHPFEVCLFTAVKIAYAAGGTLSFVLRRGS